MQMGCWGDPIAEQSSGYKSPTFIGIRMRRILIGVNVSPTWAGVNAVFFRPSLTMLSH